MVLRHLGLLRSLWSDSEICFCWCKVLHFVVSLAMKKLQSQAGASPAVSSQAVCCQEFSVLFLQSVCKFIQALGLPLPPMPNGAKFSPPGGSIQCFLFLFSLMFHLLEGLGVTAKSGPPLPQGRGKCLHLDCSNLKDARLITNFDGPPSNTDRTLNNPSQHVDTDESYTHMEGAPGLSGNLPTLPGQAWVRTFNTIVHQNLNQRLYEIVSYGFNLFDRICWIVT